MLNVFSFFMWCYYSEGMYIVLFGVSLVIWVCVIVLVKCGKWFRFGVVKFIRLIVWFVGVKFSGLM